MISYNNLEFLKLSSLYECFLEAFSDYQVQIDLPYWKFEQMLKRRGFEPKMSMGAFEDDRLIGFVLNGFRSWKGKSTAYDLGTGVIPEYRRQGLTSNMLVRIKNLFREKNVEQYLLEVLKPNESAIQLYKKEGFKAERELSCFELDKNKYINTEDKDNCKIEIVDNLKLEDFKEFWDFQPSWQNSIASIEAIPKAFTYIIAKVEESIVGYGVIETRTGDIPQIAVKNDFRRKGIASSILSELIKNTESSNINVMNIESQFEINEKFFQARGFEYEVGQYEMLLGIQ